CLRGPRRVKAGTGEDGTAEELGGADVHARHSGVVDHYAVDDDEALGIAREIVAQLPALPPPPFDVADVEPPLFPPDDLLALAPFELNQPAEAPEIIARLVDG